MTLPSDYPTQNAIERKAALAPDDQSWAQPDPDALPEPVYSKITGMMLIPGFRFNGSTTNTPWNYPEEDVFNWLTQADVEVLEDRVLVGSNGNFWGRITKPDGEVQSVVIKFAGLGREDIIDTWGTEFFLDNNEGLLSREAAGYEVLKALGAEDLSFPICIKDLNPIQLLSDVTRERLAGTLRIDQDDIDNKLGIAGTIQLVARDSENFGESWSVLGFSDKERWATASDQLRYSIYRVYLSDFVLGTPNRSVFGLQYNKNTDRVMMPDLMVSFPHSGFSAEKYLQMRVKGWGRSSGGAARFVDNTPPSCNELADLFSDLAEKHMEECLLTAQQIVARLDDETVGRLVVDLLQYDIPVECVSSVVLRIAYLGLAPGSVIKRPIEYIRNLCATARTGGRLDGKMAEIIDYVNTMMTNVMGEPFDISEILVQPLPDLAELLV